MSAIVDNKGASQVWPGSITQESLAPNVAGNGPCFSYYATAPQSIPNNTGTTISFGCKEFDTHSSVSGSRFTALVDGYFRFNAIVSLAISTGTGLIYLMKNAVAFKYGGSVALNASGSSMQLACLVKLVAGDYIDIAVYQSSGGALNTSAGQSTVSFQGFLARSAT